MKASIQNGRVVVTGASNNGQADTPSMSSSNRSTKKKWPKYDKDVVKRAMHNRWLAFYESLGLPSTSLVQEREVPCPWCPEGGNTRFRVLNVEEGVLFCSHCFYEHNGDGIAALAKILRKDQKEDFPELLHRAAEFAGVQPVDGGTRNRKGQRGRGGKNDAGSQKESNSRKLDDSRPKRSAAELAEMAAVRELGDDAFLVAVCEAKGMPISSAQVYGARVRWWGGKTTGERVVEFPLYDETGVHHVANRFGLSHVSDDEALRKGKCVKGGKHGLFLPHHDDGSVQLPRPGEMWIFVEGVKDAAALHSLGFNAAGLPTNTMNARFAPLFVGVDVVLVPDLDRAGQEGAAKTASRLAGVASSIRVARLPGEVRESSGDDVRDVLPLPDGEALVRAAISAAVAADDWKRELPPTSDSTTAASESNARPPTVPWAGFNLTELGNAERFARQHGENVRYCHVWKKWLAWDGARWRIDTMGEVERLAKRTIRSIYTEAADETIDHDEAKEIAKHASKSEQAKAISALLSLARSEQPIPIAVESLDAEPWLLNCENGTIDLRTGMLRDHRQEDYFTKRSPVEYPTEPGDEPVLWLNFLDRIFAGSAELIGFVQRMMGLSLVGEVREHILVILHGSGCNGKTVLLETWCGALGTDYSMKAPNGFLMAKRNESHPTELADLFGMRLVAVAESGDGSKLSEPLVKELCGGDTIRARRMREDNWQFAPSHTIVLATNHKPVVRGTDHGLWRRLRLVPFEVTIPDEEKDENLINKLRNELPAILRWMVEGCILWQKCGLQPPQQVMLATEEYRNTSDVFGAFLEECCLIGPQYQIKATTLYSIYKKWTEANGEYTESQTKFGTRLEERGFTKRQSNGIWRVGITNREIPKDDSTAT